MNISHLQDQASDLYFAFRSDPDQATLNEIVADMNRFAAKLAAYVANGQLRAAIAKRLLASVGH